jgi:hypothetical protein
MNEDEKGERREMSDKGMLKSKVGFDLRLNKSEEVMSSR